MPDRYVTVIITIPENEAVSFSEVASEVSRSVAEAKETHREYWPQAQRRVYPKGYLEDENAPR